MKTEDILKRIKKYGDYTILDNQGEVVTIRCDKHDITNTIKLQNVIRSSPCKECMKDILKERTKNKFDKFVIKSNKVHNNKYQYVKESYINASKKVQIICPKHGIFLQEPFVHVQKNGCPKCKGDNARKRFQYSTEQWMQKFKETHKDTYDYSLVEEITTCHQIIKVICKKHGIIDQLVLTHSMGHGCKQCANENLGISFRKKADNSFIDKAKAVHGNRYDYGETVYVSAHTKAKIKCKYHGIFLQRPNDHLTGYGCPSCYIYKSTPHKEIEAFLLENGIKFRSNDRTAIHPLEIDILADNIGIEFNGIFWHSYYKKETAEEINKHLHKYKKCKEKGIRLISINEDEWIYKKDIVKSKLLHIFGITKTKIYAKRCEVKEIPSKEYTKFVTENHIQGNKCSKYRYGLYYENVLVSCMSFSSHKKYGYEMDRFCNKMGHSIVGGASKLLAHFIRLRNPSSILTFADVRYYSGNFYEKLGFELVAHTKPNYRYVKHEKTYSRVKFQKHKLKDILKKYDDSLSESDNMFNNGYRRMWDCGNFKYLYQKKV
jgi:hypothetical protein